MDEENNNHLKQDINFQVKMDEENNNHLKQDINFQFTSDGEETNREDRDVFNSLKRDLLPCMMGDLLEYFEERARVLDSMAPTVQTSAAVSNPNFISIITFNGIPILPPVLTARRREEMQEHKRQAMRREYKRKTRQREQMDLRLKSLVKDVEEKKASMWTDKSPVDEKEIPTRDTTRKKTQNNKPAPSSTADKQQTKVEGERSSRSSEVKSQNQSNGKRRHRSRSRDSDTDMESDKLGVKKTQRSRRRTSSEGEQNDMKSDAIKMKEELNRLEITKVGADCEASKTEPRGGSRIMTLRRSNSLSSLPNLAKIYGVNTVPKPPSTQMTKQQQVRQVSLRHYSNSQPDLRTVSAENVSPPTRRSRSKDDIRELEGAAILSTSREQSSSNPDIPQTSDSHNNVNCVLPRKESVEEQPSGNTQEQRPVKGQKVSKPTVGADVQPERSRRFQVTGTVKKSDQSLTSVPHATTKSSEQSLTEMSGSGTTSSEFASLEGCNSLPHEIDGLPFTSVRQQHIGHTLEKLSKVLNMEETMSTLNSTLSNEIQENIRKLRQSTQSDPQLSTASSGHCNPRQSVGHQSGGQQSYQRTASSPRTVIRNAADTPSPKTSDSGPSAPSSTPSSAEHSFVSNTSGSSHSRLSATAASVGSSAGSVTGSQSSRKMSPKGLKNTVHFAPLVTEINTSASQSIEDKISVRKLDITPTNSLQFVSSDETSVRSVDAVNQGQTTNSGTTSPGVHLSIPSSESLLSKVALSPETDSPGTPMDCPINNMPFETYGHASEGEVNTSDKENEFRVQRHERSQMPGRQAGVTTGGLGRQAGGTTSAPYRSTGGTTSAPGRPAGGTASAPGRPAGGTTSAPGRPAGGTTSAPGRPTGGTTSAPGRPAGGTTSAPGRPAGGTTSAPGRPVGVGTSGPVRSSDQLSVKSSVLSQYSDDGSQTSTLKGSQDLLASRSGTVPESTADVQSRKRMRNGTIQSRGQSPRSENIGNHNIPGHQTGPGNLRMATQSRPGVEYIHHDMGVSGDTRTTTRGSGAANSHASGRTSPRAHISQKSYEPLQKDRNDHPVTQQVPPTLTHPITHVTHASTHGHGIDTKPGHIPENRGPQRRLNMDAGVNTKFVHPNSNPTDADREREGKAEHIQKYLNHVQRHSLEADSTGNRKPDEKPDKDSSDEAFDLRSTIQSFTSSLQSLNQADEEELLKIQAQHFDKLRRHLIEQQKHQLEELFVHQRREQLLLQTDIETYQSQLQEQEEFLAKNSPSASYNNLSGNPQSFTQNDITLSQNQSMTSSQNLVNTQPHPLNHSQEPQSDAPQSKVPQSHVPQTNVPQSHVPQSHAPQSHAPQSKVPQSHAPQSHALQSHVAQPDAHTFPLTCQSRPNHQLLYSQSNPHSHHQSHNLQTIPSHEQQPVTGTQLPSHPSYQQAYGYVDQQDNPASHNAHPHQRPPYPSYDEELCQLDHSGYLARVSHHTYMAPPVTGLQPPYYVPPQSAVDIQDPHYFRPPHPGQQLPPQYSHQNPRHPLDTHPQGDPHHNPHHIPGDPHQNLHHPQGDPRDRRHPNYPHLPPNPDDPSHHQGELYESPPRDDPNTSHQYSYVPSPSLYYNHRDTGSDVSTFSKATPKQSLAFNYSTPTPKIHKPVLRSPIKQPSLVFSDQHIFVPELAYNPHLKHCFDRVSACVKGYLTRRLLRTEKVQEILKTIKDTKEFAWQFQAETPIKRGDFSSSDRYLLDRIIAQLQAALLDVHEIFFEIPVWERMSLIAQSRQAQEERRLRESTGGTRYSLSSSQPRISSATLKAMERKRKLEEDVASDSRPRSAPPPDANLPPPPSQTAVTHTHSYISAQSSAHATNMDQRALKPLQSQGQTSKLTTRPKERPKTSPNENVANPVITHPYLHAKSKTVVDNNVANTATHPYVHAKSKTAVTTGTTSHPYLHAKSRKSNIPSVRDNSKVIDAKTSATTTTTIAKPKTTGSKVKPKAVDKTSKAWRG